jgi:molecular chaperone GrpE
MFKNTLLTVLYWLKKQLWNNYSSPINYLYNLYHLLFFKPIQKITQKITQHTLKKTMNSTTDTQANTHANADDAITQLDNLQTETLESKIGDTQELNIEPPVLDLQAQLDAALAQNITLQDLALRAQAEVNNMRRRAAEDVSKAHKYALENFADSLLPVRDTLELGLANTTQSEAALREGVEATLRLLVSAFEKHKLLAIDPVPGAKFDPTFHNGVSMMPSEHPAQTIAVVMQKGYQIGDRVMRPALVAVSSGN